MDVEPQPDTIKLHTQHSLHSHPQTYHDRAGVDQQRGQVLTSVAVWKTRGSEKSYEYAFIYNKTSNSPDVSGERHGPRQLDYGDVIVQAVGVPARLLH